VSSTFLQDATKVERDCKVEGVSRFELHDVQGVSELRYKSRTPCGGGNVL
jgi:hypothetical protein